MFPHLQDRPLLMPVLLPHTQLPVFQIKLTGISQPVGIRRRCETKIPRRRAGVKARVFRKELAARGLEQRRLPSLLELMGRKGHHTVILHTCRGTKDNFRFAKAITEAEPQMPC